MNIFTPSRFVKVLALVFIFAASISHAQHPKGLWYPCQTLPGLGSSVLKPQLLFVDSLLGYYIGEDSGYVTKDGGQSWKMMSFGPDAHPSPSYLYAPDHNTIVAYQAYNTDTDGVKFPGIIKSTDMGNSWSRISMQNFPAIVKAFTMWTINDGYRIWLDDNTKKDFAGVTHDGGITWNDIRGDATLEKYISKLQGSGSYSIHAAWNDSLHGAISVSLSSTSSSPTAYPVLITSDGGRSWTETYPKLNGDATIPHSFIYSYPGSFSLWVQPSILTKIAEYFYYSTDHGNSWNNTKPFARNELGASTKCAVIQLAPVSPTETWALLAADTEHPSLTKFMAYFDQSSGWSRGDTIKFGSKFGPYGWTLNDNGVQFTDREHGWATATQSYFDVPNQQQVTKDSTFIFSFRTSPPVKGQGDVKPISLNIALRCIPNPASSNIRIEGFSSDERIHDVKIINTLGNQFSRKIENLTSGIELDVSTIPNGCYVVSINTSLRRENLPVMVVH